MPVLPDLSLADNCIVGVSGFGGSGKSTISQALAEKHRLALVCVDSFFKSNSDFSATLWGAVDYDRLLREVILPFENGEKVAYGHFNWALNSVSEVQRIEKRSGLIIEGVGLFRPDLVGHFSSKIWIDCPIDVAVARGKRRDRMVNDAAHAELWDGAWRKRDLECFEAYRPLEMSGIIVVDNSAENPSNP